jgi:hypothetical protein
VPAAAHGRLALIYRPAWLILGSATAAACVLVILLAFALGYLDSYAPDDARKPACLRSF